MLFSLETLGLINIKPRFNRISNPAAAISENKNKQSQSAIPTLLVRFLFLRGSMTGLIWIKRFSPKQRSLRTNEARTAHLR